METSDNCAYVIGQSPRLVIPSVLLRLSDSLVT